MQCDAHIGSMVRYFNITFKKNTITIFITTAKSAVICCVCSVMCQFVTNLLKDTKAYLLLFRKESFSIERNCTLGITPMLFCTPVHYRPHLAYLCRFRHDCAPPHWLHVWQPQPLKSSCGQVIQEGSILATFLCLWHMVENTDYHCLWFVYCTCWCHDHNKFTIYCEALIMSLNTFARNNRLWCTTCTAHCHTWWMAQCIAWKTT